MRDFTEQEIERYARHIMLPEIGGGGQARLLDARVLVVGAGGLGSPLLMYLAAAGVGTIGIADGDAVDLSNLQRQVIHATPDLGRAKVESAAAHIARINPGVTVHPVARRVEAANVMDLIGGYDLVADGSDNFATRFLLNDACFFAGKPLVSAAILRFDGQLSTYKAHLGAGHPCYRCIFAEPPPSGLIPSCSEGGVLGALAGSMGGLQAVEVIKEILGIGMGLSGRMVMLDTLGMEMRTVRVPKDPACPLCGDAPKIRDLSGHA